MKRWTHRFPWEPGGVAAEVYSAFSTAPLRPGSAMLPAGHASAGYAGSPYFFFRDDPAGVVGFASPRLG